MSHHRAPLTYSGMVAESLHELLSPLCPWHGRPETGDTKASAGEIDLAASRSEPARRWDWIACLPHYVINLARRLTSNNCR
jgi:hypothetical protein